MTRAGRMFRNLLERLLGRYYEGPEPPQRIGQNVSAFATLNPRATVGDWMDFTTRYASECYRSGHVRGLEWAERDLDRRDPVTDPELLEDHRRNDWSWVQLNPSEEETKRIVARDPYDDMSPEDRALALDSVGRAMGTHRVVVDRVSDPKRR